jgi:NADH:ubiquinone oxidoreductase subunit C
VPDAPGLELILAGINAEHPGAVLDTSFDREQAALIVDPAHILDVLSWLRDTEGQGYTFLSSLHGADYLPAEPRFAVHYELLNRERYERLRVKALLHDPAAGLDGAANEINRDFVPPAFGADKYRDPETLQAETRLAEVTANPGTPAPAGAEASGQMVDGGPGSEDSLAAGEAGVAPAAESNEPVGDGGPGSAPAGAVPPEDVEPGPPDDHLPHIDSCVHLFPTAEFQEREVFDFFGIVFDGHPDMRRILMPEDYVGHPQRRDFPVGGEPVIFTRDEASNPGWWQ